MEDALPDHLRRLLGNMRTLRCVDLSEKYLKIVFVPGEFDSDSSISHVCPLVGEERI